MIWAITYKVGERYKSMTGDHIVKRVKYVLSIASMRYMLQQHAAHEDWCMLRTIKTKACLGCNEVPIA